jgi:hypothetical protein
MFEWVTTFGTEEVAIVPVSSKSDNVLTENRGLTVLATRREQFMPIEVTKETQTLISVFGHRFARLLFEYLTSCAAFDAIKPLLTKVIRLMANLHRL